MSQTVTVPSFVLESGETLHEVPVAYHSWGQLNAAGDNAIVVCHALTGSSNATDWCSGLFGSERILDPDRNFIICANVLGSPYGTASPVTTDPTTGAQYGIEFPKVTIRDTVQLHRRLLNKLGVRSVALAIGGSMGGMQVLEWAFEQADDSRPYVRALVPIAVGGRHAAWQIGWSEAQRQAIYSDPNWNGGHYAAEEAPRQGLATARMMAMVAYRSHRSFGERFGRERMAAQDETGPFAVESYLRYQGQKLIDRFDANCYVRLTQQMDSHNVARNRGSYPDILESIAQPTLVVGIDSDVLYPLEEQEELADHIPHATLEVLHSKHGHDAFLIETDALNKKVLLWHRFSEEGERVRR